MLKVHYSAEAIFNSKGLKVHTNLRYFSWFLTTKLITYGPPLIYAAIRLSIYVNSPLPRN